MRQAENNMIENRREIARKERKRKRERARK